MGIQLDLSNPNRSYFAGQSLDGWVVIPNTKRKDVKDITIWITGTGTAYNNTLTKCKNGNAIISYTDKETYISFKSHLNEPSSISSSGESLIYPFHLLLPQNIPSSLSSPNCQITYHLMAEVRLHSQKWIERARLPFTVNGIFDLNLTRGVNLPQTCKKPNGFNVFGHGKGLQLSLPERSGFVPGEVVNFLVDIRNKSGKEANATKLSLLQVITLNPNAPPHPMELPPMTIKQIVKVVKGPLVGGGGRVKWKGTLEIPSVPPTGLGGKCRIADLQYFIRFEMNGSDSKKKGISGELSILIGTIPLRSTFPDFYNAGGAITSIPAPAGHDSCPRTSWNGTGALNVNVSFNPPTHVLPDYPDLPPPSYAEAVAATADSDGKSHGKTGVEMAIGSTLAMPGAEEEGILAPLNKADFVPNYITHNRRA